MAVLPAIISGRNIAFRAIRTFGNV